jgi:fibronectin-binding autotransporter adhesin
MRIRSTFLALFAVPVSSMAVDFHWNATTGDWATGSNWTPAGPPGGGGGNFAFVSNGGTATISGDTNPIQDPFIGRGGAGTGVGTVNHTAGMLNASAGWTFIGTNGGTGTYNMTGSSSITTGQIWLGSRDADGSNGTMTMDTTGTVTVATMRIGDNDGVARTSTGTLNITNGTIHNSGEFQVGRWGGVGTVNQSGGTVNVNGGWFGIANDNAGSAGSRYSISGGSLNLNNSVNAEIGADTTGIFELSGTGTFTTNQFFVGFRSGGNGILNQSGGSLTARAGESQIGGNAGATGVYNLSGGTVTMDSNLQVGASGTGTLNMTGGTINNTGWLVVGRFTGGNGTANVSAGQILHNNAGTSIIVGEQGTGVLNISGTGLVSVNSPVGLRVGHTPTGNGTVNLDGGTLEAHVVQKTDAASIAKFNFNGGTLKALAGSGDFFVGMSSANLEVKAGGAVIHTNGFDIAINQGLNGAGGLNKLGSGTLTLNGISTYAGQTIVSAGTLKLGAGASLNASSVVDVAAGASFDGSAVVGGIIIPPSQTLKGNGTLIGDTTVAGTLAPGNSIGTISVTGSVTLTGTSDFELDASIPDADLLVATGDINYGGTLNLSNLAGAFSYGQTYDLFDASTFGGDFSAINWPAGTTVANWVNDLDNTGSIIFVPEPGTTGLLALVLAGLARRRRA